MKATDLVESLELSEEIYKEREQLTQMVIALEEAIDAVDDLEKRHDKNNELLEGNERITDDDIQLTNEAIAINCSILGNEDDYNKYRVSTESDMTRYEMLQLSNENLSDLIETIKEKIIQTFERVVAFFKRQYLKIIAWINPYEKQLKKLKEKVNKLKDTKLLIRINEYDIEKAISGLSLYSPNLSKKFLRNKNNISGLLRTILTEECDASKIFDRLLNNTKLKQLLTDLCEVNPKGNLFTTIENFLSDRDEGCALLCRVDKANLTYILSTKNDDKVKLEYKKERIFLDTGNTVKFKEECFYRIKPEDFEDYKSDETELNKQDILNFINNLDNSLISKLRDAVRDITKIQKELVNTVKEKIKKDSSDNSVVKAAIYIGSRASTDNIYWLFDTIKASIKIAKHLYDQLEFSIDYNLKSKYRSGNDNIKIGDKVANKISSKFDNTLRPINDRINRVLNRHSEREKDIMNDFEMVNDRIRSAKDKADKSLSELREKNKELREVHNQLMNS